MMFKLECPPWDKGGFTVEVSMDAREKKVDVQQGGNLRGGECKVCRRDSHPF